VPYSTRRREEKRNSNRNRKRRELKTTGGDSSFPFFFFLVQSLFGSVRTYSRKGQLCRQMYSGNLSTSLSPTLSSHLLAQCNGLTGLCDIPTAIAAGCDKCQQCNSSTGQCYDDHQKFSACSGDQCTICDRVNGGCKPDDQKVNCADKCTKVRGERRDRE
jgi:hypothetical protein